MNTTRNQYLILGLCACIQIGLTAHAATIGACTSSSSGSVTATGSNGYTATGVPSFNDNDSEASGVCTTSGEANLGGSGAGGVPYGGIETQNGSSGNATSSGGLLTLSGSGSTTINGSTSGGTSGPIQNMSLSASGATSLQQAFALSAGEVVDYTLNVNLSGNTGAIGYAVAWTPNFSITLGGSSGPSNMLVSGYNAIEFNNFPWSTTVSGDLVNKTGAAELFTLTTTANYSDTTMSGGSGNHPEQGNGVLDFQYNMNIAPVPLPAAGWLMLCGLGGAGAIARKRRAHRVTVGHVT